MSEPFRWKIGDVEVIKIAESCSAFPPSVLLKPAIPAAIAPHVGWLKPHFMDEDGNLLISVHGLLVISQGLKIIVDTCIGPRVLDEHTPLPTNAFFDNLALAGFDPGDIDIVLCTHLHFDHVGWNTMKVGDAWVPSFPNARYFFARNEWDHWHSAQDKGYAMTLGECVQPIIDAGIADLVEMDQVLTDEVRLVPTPGHTPGHVSAAIESQGKKAFITGDTVFHPVQWAEIEWGSDADNDVPQAIAMRGHLRETYGTDDNLIIGTHFASPSAGHVRREKDGWWFEADTPTNP